MQILFLLAVLPFLIKDLSHTKAVKWTTSVNFGWPLIHPLSSAASPSGKVTNRRGPAATCITEDQCRAIACFQVTFQAGVHELSGEVSVCVCARACRSVRYCLVAYRGAMPNISEVRPPARFLRWDIHINMLQFFLSGLTLVTFPFPLPVSRLQLGKYWG